MSGWRRGHKIFDFLHRFWRREAGVQKRWEEEKEEKEEKRREEKKREEKKGEEKSREAMTI